MANQEDTVPEALHKIKAAVDKFHSYPAPNEPITEIDYGKFCIAVKKLETRFNNIEQDNLIESLNEAISELTFPEIDQSVASRGLLLTQVHGYELVRSLQHAKNRARALGFRDPDIANLDVSSPISAKQIHDINTKLDDLQKYTQQLDSQLKKSGQLGIAVGVGGLSVDLGILLNMVKDTTFDAREYISAQYAINTEVLQDKFAVVNSSAKSLMDVIASNAKLFGRNIMRLGNRVAKAAADVYGSGLKLIKSAYENMQPQQTLPPATADYVPLSDNIIKRELDATSNDYNHAGSIIIINIVSTLKARRSALPFNKDTINKYELFASHNKNFMQIKIGAENASFTYQLSKMEYDVLMHLSPRLIMVLLTSSNSNL